MRPALLWCLALPLMAQEGAWTALPRGEVLPRVACASDASLHYALYLPKSLPSQGPWPLLVLLDPIAQGEKAVTRFQQAADRSGVAVLASLDSRNALPGSEYDRILKALLADVMRRCPSGPRFVGGFSGGARVAVNVARRSPGLFQGVLAVGAFFDQKEGLPASSEFAVLLACGDSDFNYLEMRRAQAELTRTGLRNWWMTFPGPHRWVPSELACDALEWLMLVAARQAHRPMAAREEAFRSRMLEDAGVLASKEHPRQALQRIQMLLADFPNGSGALTERSTELASLPEVRQELALEARYAVLQGELQTQPSLEPYLQKLLALGRRVEKGSAPERRLAALVLDRELMPLEQVGLKYLAEKRWPEAARIWAAFTELRPKEADAPLQAAIAYAQWGQHGRALDFLEQAVDRGYADGEVFDRPELEPLKGSRRAQELRARMKALSGAQK